MTPACQRGRAAAPLLLALALAAVVAWRLATPTLAAPPAPTVPAPAPLLATTAGAIAPAIAPLPPALGLSAEQRRDQQVLWRQRLERAQQALANYQQAARYPNESRPIEEHPDQLRPFAPVADERPLRMPGGSVTAGVRLRTTQERIFIAGSESSRVTVALVDAEGRALPLRATRAVLHEVTEPGRTASTPEFTMAVNEGSDGVLSAVIQPARQGFATYAGTVRLDLLLDHAGAPGFLFFDVIYSPEQAAAWLPGATDAVAGGDLRFTLRAQVLIAGRYVVSARIDDAAGTPVALALFNAELGRGEQAIALPVAGRLLHDRKPAFPLALRDVEAFLLKPDAFPDRVMLPRLAGVVHRSAVYELGRFANAEPQSDQRDRYLAELGKDVREAEQQLQALGP